MTLFAKLLAVLNVIAAVAFAILAVLDLAKGTPWRRDVVLHDKALEGPPVATADPNFQRDEDLDDIFEPARDALAQAVEKAKGDDAAKRKLLEQTLLTWARPDQRDKVKEKLNALQNVGLKDLLADLRRPLRQSQALAEIRPLIEVSTQQDEVKRWHDDLLNDLRGKKDEQAKRDRLQQILVPLAETRSERAEIARRIQTERFDQLLAGPFESAFPKPIPPETESDQPGPDPKESREKRGREIAHLLYTLSQLRGPDGQLEDPVALPRTKVVVGLRNYNREAERQAVHLREMVQELRAAMVLGKYSDRAQFLAQHQERIHQLQQLAADLDDVVAVLNGQKQELEKLEVQVKARRDVVDQRQAELKKAQAETQKELEKQAGQEKELFDSQRAVAEAANENARLERDIRRLEGLKPEASPK
jgi:hypothetical protein